MKKSLKIFTLAASFLQAALFSAFAANPPSDFKYELTKDNKAVRITQLKGDKTKYVIPASIEDFPVKEVDICVDESCTISLPEGIEYVRISNPLSGGVLTPIEGQLPSTVKSLNLFCCKYDGIFPNKIEKICILGSDYSSEDPIKLNQSFAELQNLKNLYLKKVDFIGVANSTPFKMANMDSLLLEYVNLIGNKTIYIRGDNSEIYGTNVEEIIFEEGVTKIERNFSNNKNLKKIVLPSTLKSVVVGIFDDCPNLTEVVVPDSLANVEVEGTRRYGTPLYKVFDTTSLSLKSQAKLKNALNLVN